MLNFMATMVFAWSVMGITLLFQNLEKNGSVIRWAITLIVALTLPFLELLPILFPIRTDLVRNLFLLPRVCSYLIGPCMYLYGYRLIYSTKIAPKTVVIHGVPFLLWTIFFLIQILSGRMTFTLLPPKPDTHVFLFGIGNAVSLLLYGFFVLRLIKKHRLKVFDYYSSIPGDLTLSWLKKVVFIYLLLFGSAIFMAVVRTRFMEEQLLIPQELVNLFPMAVFIFIFTLKSISQRHIGLLKKKDPSAVNSETKYQRSGLAKDEVEALLSRLKFLMEEEKIFTDPELSLINLSRQLNTPKHHLSQVINSVTGSNFYHYVNEHRVLEFQKALKENRFPNYTLTGIALECGFSSSSSFFSVFKKYTGMTPKQYSQNPTSAQVG